MVEINNGQKSIFIHYSQSNFYLSKISMFSVSESAIALSKYRDEPQGDNGFSGTLRV